MSDAPTAAPDGALDALSLRLSEIYLSLQGESTFAGLPCVFVRTTGCPLRCVWCDTAYAFFGGEDQRVADVLARVLAHDVELVEITGGEPLAQRNVLPLMSALADAGRTVLLETSGAFDIAPVDDRVHIIMDIKCPDSGEHEKNLWDNVERLRHKDEVKLVLASRRDYEFARDVIRQRALAERCKVLISTVWQGPERADVVRWMLEDALPARFQLQMHKLIWDPAARGV